VNWYYVKEGQQTGPISQGELAELFASGKITGETLIWREGLPQWQSYTSVLGSRASAEAIPPLAAPPGMVQCAECGRMFTKEEIIDFNGKAICATCKPIFLQRLREGAGTPGTLAYAGFWVRFVAKVVDGIILGAVGFGVGSVLGVGGFMVGQQTGTFNPAAMMAAIGLSSGVGLVLRILYNTIMTAKFGATLGKMALGLKVVTPDQGPITFGRSLGRAFAELLSGIICSIGYIMAAFDDERRTLHDRLANTRVIVKPK
jgi:uncharacterized RDD family membrane protein YckC